MERVLPARRVGLTRLSRSEYDVFDETSFDVCVLEDRLLGHLLRVGKRPNIIRPAEVRRYAADQRNGDCLCFRYRNLVPKEYSAHATGSSDFIEKSDFEQHRSANRIKGPCPPDIRHVVAYERLKVIVFPRVNGFLAVYGRIEFG